MNIKKKLDLMKESEERNESRIRKHIAETRKTPVQEQKNSSKNKANEDKKCPK